MGEKKQKLIPFVLLLIAITVILCIVLSLPFIISSQKEITLPDCVVSTKDKAIEIALPLAQTYAQENNRDITTMAGEVHYVDARPCWQIDINFKAVKNGEHVVNGHPYGIYGYAVLIWADTGEIYHHDPQGAY